MEQRLLGSRTGLRVSRIALGTGRIGADKEGGIDAEAADRVLEAFAEAGGTFIDTSSAYGGGRSEAMLGAFLARAGRDRFVIASKYGRTPDAAPPAAAVGCHRGAMRREVEGSLRRLGTDRIDLYFPHFDDGVTPIEEIMRGLDDLVRAGKVVHVGLSNVPAWRAASAATLADLRGWAPLAALQLRYSLLARDADRELLPLARALGLGVMGYSPLAGGGLVARARRRGTEPGATDEGEGSAVIDALLDVAADLGREPADVALAWACATGVVPVIGPRTPEQLAPALATVARLGEAHMRRLEKASRPVLGYPHDLLAHARAHVGITEPRAGLVP